MNINCQLDESEQSQRRLETPATVMQKLLKAVVHRGAEEQFVAVALQEDSGGFTLDQNTIPYSLLPIAPLLAVFLNKYSAVFDECSPCTAQVFT